jgi:hypothetical protein
MSALATAPGPTRAKDAVRAWRPRSAAARGALVLAAVASLAAAVAHAQVAPEHFAEWWGYGTFFVVAAAAQLALAAILLAFAVGRERALPAVARREALVYGAGIVGNALLVALWAWTRLVGDFVGPMAGSKEEIGLVDVAAKACEAATVAALAALWVRRR